MFFSSTMFQVFGRDRIIRFVLGLLDPNRAQHETPKWYALEKWKNSRVGATPGKETWHRNVRMQHVDMLIWWILRWLPSLKLTYPLRMDGWKTILSFRVSAYFEGQAVSFKEGTLDSERWRTTKPPRMWWARVNRCVTNNGAGDWVSASWGLDVMKVEPRSVSSFMNSWIVVLFWEINLANMRSIRSPVSQPSSFH